jgi:ketosteroid isomerase-like protein
LDKAGWIATSWAAVSLTFLSSAGADALAKPTVTTHPMTPEIQLIDDYNTWFSGVALDPDVTKLKAGLPKYITKDTILHEATSLPWGGTMIGFDGWVHLNQNVAPVFDKILPLVGGSEATYYQRGNVVVREINMTIKASKEAPTPFAMGIIEKYTIRDGRIAQIDEFYADTASLIARLRALGALPDGKQ